MPLVLSTSFYIHEQTVVLENYHAHCIETIEGHWKFRGRGGQGRKLKKTKRSIMLNLNFQRGGVEGSNQETCPGSGAWM